MKVVLTPKQIKDLCEQYGLRPSKSYGQHYLVSDAPIKKMIEAAELSKEDTVVEIGPGFGVLTLAVAPLVKRVIAFEIEQKLKPYWEEKQKEYPNVEIVWGNVLKAYPHMLPLLGGDIGTLPLVGGVGGGTEGPRYKVLANLPYHITSDALRTILEANPPPERVVVMVQKEVAERITAKPPEMSMLSVAVQYYGAPKIVTVVPKGAFWPRPKVDSAIVSLPIVKGTLATRVPHLTSPKRGRNIVLPLVGGPTLVLPLVGGVGGGSFFRVVRAGFSHKRKQVWRNLSAGLHLPAELVKETLRQVVGNDTVRAEELSVEEWKHFVGLLDT